MSYYKAGDIGLPIAIWRKWMAAGSPPITPRTKWWKYLVGRRRRRR